MGGRSWVQGADYLVKTPLIVPIASFRHLFAIKRHSSQGHFRIDIFHSISTQHVFSSSSRFRLCTEPSAPASTFADLASITSILVVSRYSRRWPRWPRWPLDSFSVSKWHIHCCKLDIHRLHSSQLILSLLSSRAEAEGLPGPKSALFPDDDDDDAAYVVLFSDIPRALIEFTDRELGDDLRGSGVCRISFPPGRLLPGCGGACVRGSRNSRNRKQDRRRIEVARVVQVIGVAKG